MGICEYWVRIRLGSRLVRVLLFLNVERIYWMSLLTAGLKYVQLGLFLEQGLRDRNDNRCLSPFWTFGNLPSFRILSIDWLFIRALSIILILLIVGTVTIPWFFRVRRCCDVCCYTSLYCRIVERLECLEGFAQRLLLWQNYRVCVSSSFFGLFLFFNGLRIPEAVQ